MAAESGYNIGENFFPLTIPCEKKLIFAHKLFLDFPGVTSAGVSA
jgi:hypothetical protein